MKKTMYRASSMGIAGHEVVRESPKSVTYLERVWTMSGYTGETKERREMKESDWHSWHNTFEDAKAHLIGIRKGKIEASLRKIQHLEEEIREIESMTKC